MNDSFFTDPKSKEKLKVALRLYGCNEYDEDEGAHIAQGCGGGYFLDRMWGTSESTEGQRNFFKNELSKDHLLSTTET